MATKRIFSYDGRDHGDPDPTQTPEQMKQLFTTFFPELANATIREVKKEGEPDTTIYVFERLTGTKG
jgi:PRTRC genetic system protein C